jgi:hypothetical protein
MRRTPGCSRDNVRAVPPPAHQHRPDERTAGPQHLKPGRPHQGLDPGDRVDKCPKGVSCPPAPMVLPPGVGPHVPAVMRKVQGVIPLGLLRRARSAIRAQDNHTTRSRVTSSAEPSSEARDTKSRGESAPGPGGHGAPSPLRPRRHRPPPRDVGAPAPSREQFMMKDADAGSDIEERPWRDAEVTQALQDEPGSSARAPLPVLGQLRLCSSRREMAIGRHAMATRHGSRSGPDASHDCLRRTLLQLRLVGITESRVRPDSRRPASSIGRSMSVQAGSASGAIWPARCPRASSTLRGESGRT